MWAVYIFLVGIVNKILSERKVSRGDIEHSPAYCSINNAYDKTVIIIKLMIFVLGILMKNSIASGKDSLTLILSSTNFAIPAVFVVHIEASPLLR